MAMGQPMGGAPARSTFDVARERAGQRATADAQQGQDALKRRFASLGGLNSGAAVKMQQQAEEGARAQREQTIQGIDAQEADQNFQRDFQAAEAQKGRDFQSLEAQKGRDFQGAQSDIDRGFQNKVFEFDKDSKLKQLDLAERQFGLQREEMDYNKRLNAYNLGQQGGLFGGGGTLGLGFNTKPKNI